MKYSIQCRYSIVEQTFMFLIRSTENQYEFTWLLSNIDKPVYVLTNNNIVLKAEMEDNFVMFSVAESEKPLNEQIVMTKTVPMMTFETDEENLQIVYDYDHIPTLKDKFIGKVIHEFLEVAGGGFLENVEDYNYLENNIAIILDDYSNVVNKPKTTTEKKRTTKTAKTAKENTDDNVKNTEEIKAKTTVKKTRKTTKKEVK